MSSFSSITRARYVHKATRNRSHVATTTGFFSVNFLFLFHRLKNCSILQLLTLTSVWHWNYPIIGFTFLFFILWEILHIFHTFFFKLFSGFSHWKSWFSFLSSLFTQNFLLFFFLPCQIFFIAGIAWEKKSDRVVQDSKINWSCYERFKNKKRETKKYEFETTLKMNKWVDLLK